MTITIRCCSTLAVYSTKDRAEPLKVTFSQKLPINHQIFFSVFDSSDKRLQQIFRQNFIPMYKWYFPVKCRESCPVNTHGSNCSMSCQCDPINGRCSPIDGSCMCGVGWTGQFCEEGKLSHIVGFVFFSVLKSSFFVVSLDFFGTC